MLRKNRARTVCALACLCGFARFSSAAQILGYQFDETGTFAAATGTASTAGTPVLNFQVGGSGAAADLHGAAGSGVSGAPGDRAFNNSATNGMGGPTNTGGGRALHSADFASIDTLTSFTLSGWFKTDSTQMVGNQAILISNRSGVNGFELRGDPNTNGALVLAVNNNSVSSSAVFTATQQWVNFAVTYDGTAAQPGPNVFFYVGGVNQPLTLAGSGTNISGSVADETALLSVGALKFAFNNNNVNPFDGFLDNLRIHNNVLTLAQLETARLTDVPEPGSAVLLAGGIAATLIRRRRIPIAVSA